MCRTQAAQPHAAARETQSQQHQSAASSTQHPVFRVQRSTFFAAAEVREAVSAAVLPPQHAADGGHRSAHNSHSTRQTDVLAHADAEVATERSAVSLHVSEPLLCQQAEHSDTKAEVRARRAGKVRELAQAQLRRHAQQGEFLACLSDRPASQATPRHCEPPDARHSSNHVDHDAERAADSDAAAEQTAFAQPMGPSKLRSDAVASLAQGWQGRLSGGRSALILTAKGTTIELYSRSVSGSRRDPVDDAAVGDAAISGGAHSACQASKCEGSATDTLARHVESGRATYVLGSFSSVTRWCSARGDLTHLDITQPPASTC